MAVAPLIVDRTEAIGKGTAPLETGEVMAAVSVDECEKEKWVGFSEGMRN